VVHDQAGLGRGGGLYFPSRSWPGIVVYRCQRDGKKAHQILDFFSCGSGS